MTGFWKAWMDVWCWVMFAAGLVFVGAAHPAADGGARLFYEIVGQRSGATVFDGEGLRLAMGLVGAIFSAWALAMMALVRAAETLGAPVWRALTGSVLFWWVADSAVSIITGYPLNALSNTLITAGYLAPVLGSGVMRLAPRPAHV